MGQTTPKGYPYPVGTDLARDGDDAIQALAEKLEATAPMALACGTVGIALTNASSGQAAVTFPAGRFSTTPVVVASCTSHATFNSVPSAATATGFTMSIRNIDAAAVSTTINSAWQAIQMTPTTGPG